MSICRVLRTMYYVLVFCVQMMSIYRVLCTMYYVLVLCVAIAINNLSSTDTVHYRVSPAFRLPFTGSTYDHIIHK